MFSPATNSLKMKILHTTLFHSFNYIVIRYYNAKKQEFKHLIAKKFYKTIYWNFSAAKKDKNLLIKAFLDENLVEDLVKIFYLIFLMAL
ncbi:hypothetical protein BTA37_16465 [Priestia megaterium]|nr:hypothetical protein BTA37_16465 [Priestia megaterium]PFR94339.1 hypothetical protein COK39_17105 [Priestia megaterium]